MGVDVCVRACVTGRVTRRFGIWACSVIWLTMGGQIRKSMSASLWARTRTRKEEEARAKERGERETERGRKD